jgi:hypothetical protein
MIYNFYKQDYHALFIEKMINKILISANKTANIESRPALKFAEVSLVLRKMAKEISGPSRLRLKSARVGLCL